MRELPSSESPPGTSHHLRISAPVFPANQLMLLIPASVLAVSNRMVANLLKIQAAFQFAENIESGM